jgi:hypothetical protein
MDPLSRKHEKKMPAALIDDVIKGQRVLPIFRRMPFHSRQLAWVIIKEVGATEGTPVEDRVFASTAIHARRRKAIHESTESRVYCVCVRYTVREIFRRHEANILPSAFLFMAIGGIILGKLKKGRCVPSETAIFGCRKKQNEAVKNAIRGLEPTPPEAKLYALSKYRPESQYPIGT